MVDKTVSAVHLAVMCSSKLVPDADSADMYFGAYAQQNCAFWLSLDCVEPDFVYFCNNSNFCFN